MSPAHRTPLFTKSRLQLVLYAPVALFSSIALPLTWTCWDTLGTLSLLWFECVLISLGLVIAEPERFHWAGRVLMGLLAAMAGMLALQPPDGPGIPLWGLALLGLPCLWYAALGWFRPYVDTSRDREIFYGRLDVAEGRLLFCAERYRWELLLDDVEAVGELVIEDLGPDHFLCFVREGATTWNEVPASAVGMEEALPRLEAIFGVTLRFDLANRTDFASRVMWPTDLAECPLFALAPEKRSWIPFFGGGQEYSLDPRLVEGLRRRAKGGS